MASKVLMSVEQYLHTSFDGADCEYVDGEIVERNVGQTLHGKIQLWLSYVLASLASKIGLQLGVEVRIRISASRYRIPDISVWRSETDIGDGIPKAPPFLAIEILSPDDRVITMLEKIEEYFAGGRMGLDCRSIRAQGDDLLSRQSRASDDGCPPHRKSSY